MFRILISLSLAAAAHLCLWAEDKTSSLPPPRPNVILMLADDMGFSDLGFYGSEIATPHLDLLAAQGLAWTNFVNNARCSPSRASLLTGCYPHRVGIGLLDGDNGKPGYRGFIRSDALTLAEVMREGGYRTFMSGKWHVGDEAEHFPHDRGFDHWYGCLAGGVYWYPSQALERTIERDGSEEAPTDPQWYSTDAFTDAAIEYIREAHAANQPFFGYLPYIAPHFPLQAKPADIAKYANTYAAGWDVMAKNRWLRQRDSDLFPDDWPQPSPLEGWEKLDPQERKLSQRKMAIYAAMVDNLDQNVGRLVEALNELGLMEDTLILFLSDNGAAAVGGILGFDKLGTEDLGGPASFSSYGSRWAAVSNTPFRGAKAEIYEGGIRSPLIMHWPARFGSEGRIIRERAHIMDLMPTLLALCGVEMPQSGLAMDGRDLSFVFGSAPISPPERRIGWEHLGQRGVQQGQWKLVGGETLELFDISEDPLERRPLIDPHRSAALEAWWNDWAHRNQVFPKP